MYLVPKYVFSCLIQGNPWFTFALSQPFTSEHREQSEHKTASRELRTTAPFSKETHIHHSCPGVLGLIELALTNAAEA